jgi:hypothetical protein
VVRVGDGQRKQDGVKVFDPTGKPIAFIRAARALRQRLLRRRQRNRLFMAAATRCTRHPTPV